MPGFLPATSTDQLQNPRLILCLFALIMLAAVGIRCIMVMLDINILLDQGLIQDDAFYYYEIARFLLRDGVPSFDGLNPTNGFHPLWQAICLPVFAVWEGEAPLRLMLSVAAFLDLCSLVLIFTLLRQLTGQSWCALCGMALWALHGTLVRTWFNGLETALHILSLLMFLAVYLKVLAIRQEAGSKESMGLHVLLGVLAGLAFLARTDAAVIVLVMFACLYIPPLLQRGEVAHGLMASLVCLCLIAPWLIWNQLTFGSIVQISGKISGSVWLVGGLQQHHNPFVVDVLQGLWASVTPVGNVVKKMFVPFPSRDWVGYVFLLPLVFLYLRAQSTDSDLRHAARMLRPFLWGVVVLFLYHAGVRQFVRGWYNAPVLLLLVFILAILWGQLLGMIRCRMGQSLSFLVLCLVLLFCYSPYDYIRSPKRPLHDPRIAAAEWLNQHLGEGVLVGAANAGIVGYYAVSPVINLDGVVNDQAHAAKLVDQIHRYVHETGIDYLVDHKGSMVHLCASNAYYRCEEINRWDNATVLARVVRD